VSLQIDRVAINLQGSPAFGRGEQDSGRRARQRTPHWLMREAISPYVEREEKRESFRQDAIKTWDEYQASRLRATLEEADAWLAKLEAGQDIEPPECYV
jgi:predicted transcriptional regulator